MALYYPPTQNGLQKTLGAQLDSGATAAVTLNNTTGIQNKAGVFVVNRIDSDGNEKTASDREYISFTGVSGSTLTGLTRNVDGSTSDQDHAVGSVVEFIPDVIWADGILDALDNAFTAAGALDTTKVVDLTTAQTLTSKTLTSPAMTTPSVTSGDVKLATGLNIQVNNADPDRIIELPASTWSPTTTSGCADVATVEAGTNDIDYKVLDFDASSDENAFCNFQMPTSYNGGVIQFRYVWTNAGGGAAETVVFELSGRAYADDGAIDQAVGTAVELSDTWIAQGDIHVSGWSGDVTLAGSPAGGQWVHLEIMRDVSEDDLTGDARLIGVQIRYKQAQYSE